ncbi:MAG: hypothetical protein HXL41_00430, partial [Solobacterium sp.]|nr:hypothetical protein [Solobacterium sp.]
MKKNDSIKISGFIVGHQPTDVAIFKYFVGNREEHIEYTTVVRNDVSNKYFQKTYKNSYGFSIILPLKKQAELQVSIGNETHIFHINQIFLGWESFIIKLRNSKFVVKLKEFIRNLYQRKVTYKSWFKLTKASKEEL